MQIYIIEALLLVFLIITTVCVFSARIFCARLSFTVSSVFVPCCCI